MEPITDETRLECLEMLGGRCVIAPTGQFMAIFKDPFMPIDTGEVVVEAAQPMLTCRTSDVHRLQLRKDMLLEVDGTQYRLVRHEPGGSGLSRLVLRTP